MFNKIRKSLLGGMCLGGVILMPGGCAWLVFDELSDMRDGGGGSTSNGGAFVSGAQFGGSDEQIVYGAAVDSQGRVVLAGVTLGNNMQDLGCDAVNGGGLDMFTTWVDPDDLKVQCPTSRLLGGKNSDVPFGIAADPKSGGVGIAGFFMSDFDCGSGGLTNQGGRDLVVATFVGNSCFWQQSFGDDKDQEGQTIAFDSVGAAYVGGRFEGTLDFEAPRVNNTNGYDAFIVKLPFGGGTPSWSIQASGEGDQEVHQIAVPAEDSLIVGGRFSNVIDFNCLIPGITQNPANDALFVAALDGKDNCKWLVKIAEGLQGDSAPLSLAVAGDGDIFVAGGFRSRTLFPDQPKCQQINETQAEDLFVAKLNLNGECQWSRRYGEINPLVAEQQRALAMTVDAASNVYVTGEFQGSISFGEKQEFQSVGPVDAFVLKLNSAGEHVWSNALAGTGSEVGNAIVLDASGEFVFVAGSFADGSLNLGAGPFTPTNSDVFLAKFAR